MVGRRLLHIRDVIGLIGFAPTFGFSLYLVSANALGYLTGTPSAFFWALLCVLGSAAASLWWTTGPTSPLQYPPRGVFFVLAGLVAAVGIVHMRILTSDPWMISTLPLASTIAAGNFPVHEVHNPWVSMGYHYGVAFFAGAFSWLSGISLSASFHMQSLWGAVGAIFLPAALVYRVTRSWSVTLWGVVLGTLGGGFAWFHVFPLLQDLFRHYILQIPLAYPFAQLSPTFASMGLSLAIAFNLRWFTLGFGMLFGIFYALYGAFTEDHSRLRYLWCVVAIVLSAAIALVMETSLVLLFPVIAAFVLFLLIEKDTPIHWRRALLLGVLVLVPAMTVALIQGGILTQMLHPTEVGLQSFTIIIDGAMGYMYTGERRMFFWDPLFLQSVGLPLFLFPIVLVYLWKKRKEWPFFMVIALFAAANILLPFVITFVPRNNEFIRILQLGLICSSLLIGCVLGDMWRTYPVRFVRIPLLFVGFLMVFSSLIYLPTRLIIPTLRFESAPFFAPMPSITPAQKRLYEWIKEHTTLQDYFYLRTRAGVQSDDIEQQQRDRILFMTYTGRYTVGSFGWGSMSQEHIAASQSAEEQCDESALRTLEVRYLVVENAKRAEWFETTCDLHMWDIRYQEPDNTLPYPRIYERRF